jgi:hypothetical protein
MKRARKRSPVYCASAVRSPPRCAAMTPADTARTYNQPEFADWLTRA